MNDKQTLLTLLALGALAFGGYLLIQRSRPQPEPLPPQADPSAPTPSDPDVVDTTPGFGLRFGDPCKRFPELCNFW